MRSTSLRMGIEEGRWKESGRRPDIISERRVFWQHEACVPRLLSKASEDLQGQSQLPSCSSPVAKNAISLLQAAHIAFNPQGVVTLPPSVFRHVPQG
ncbi:hypothetical protein SKAU_G00175300 [Synaphobranchus kaupii]|uniref:Uncharacterized protein n=1 Tax=Synaphobranchus kaupii TaxID=118154 RepID=A0A9Q1J154_SYNKA|nr:hypothetical protein SKAU_G00175300 [Synaphobranchus kaupii]